MTQIPTDLKCPLDGSQLIKNIISGRLLNDIYYVCQGKRKHVFENGSPIVKGMREENLIYCHYAAH